MKRKDFLKFLGWGSVGVAVAPHLSFCQVPYALDPIAPSSKDKLILHPDLSFSILAHWGQEMPGGLSFGFNNDFTQFLPIDDTRAKLWVNHEYIDPFFVSKSAPEHKTKEHVLEEMQQVGGSIWNLKKVNGSWEIDDAVDGYQLHANVPIPFANNAEVAGSKQAIGTLANCSGGLTPWGTVLTCEENYDAFWGECTDPKEPTTKGYYGWEKLEPRPSEHYGWVVEFDPETNKAKKHTTLGRCAHECAHVVEQPDKTVVVYTGDDCKFQCLYKFVGTEAGSLEYGTLFVANVEKGVWIPLDIDKQPELKSYFNNQTEVLTYLRKASDLVGGSKLDRPEDIERDPNTGDILIALTNNTDNNNPFGSILKITELDGYGGTNFKSETYLAGGPEMGFACPDNMAFDPKGNLWFTSDISGYKTNLPPFTAFGNNGLFLVPNSGDKKGQVIQVASSPVNAELTGPCFSEDGKHLFLSVQHPGEGSDNHAQYKSNWPFGGNHQPKPAVVVISGQLLDEISAI